ncbi:MAG: ABC transporter substrate-binding protein [Actinobacteria bacterium]|nr:ABC transporter substrate-binding protein [Actinomycetota bacterium]
MTRWNRPFALVVAVAALVLAACTSGGGGNTQTPAATGSTGPQRGGVLKLADGNDVVTLDNSQAVSTIDYSLTAGALYEGLYHVDTSGNIVAALADGLPTISADNLTYTIKIRPGAMFAGPNFTPRAVTAQDAAYGMERALDPNTKPAPSWGGGYLYPIQGASAFASGKATSVSGIKVLDPSTLQITLTQPTSTFIYDLTIATSWPAPEEAVKAAGDKFGDSPVGAGPFYVAEWNKGQSLVLKKNPGYVDPQFPYLDEIDVALNVDSNTQVLQLQNGTIDAPAEPFFLPEAAIQQLSQDPSITMAPTTGPTVYYWALNNEGILKNATLRKAIAMAINRDVTKQFGTEARPWNQIYASVTHQSDANIQAIAYDPTQAKALLQQAGYNGQPIRVIYDATDPFASAMSTSLQQDLKAIGVKVEIKGLQQAAYFGDNGYNNPKNYDMLPTYWREDYPDGQDFISTNFVCAQVPAPGLNVARYCNKQVDSLLSKSDLLPFGPQRDQILQKIQQIIVSDAAGVGTMQVDWPAISTQRVGALVTIPTYAPFDWKSCWVKSS